MPEHPRLERYRPRIGDKDCVDFAYDCPRCGRIGNIRAEAEDSLLNWAREGEEDAADVRVLNGDPGGVLIMLGGLALCRNCMKAVERTVLVMIFGEALTEQLVEIHRQRDELMVRGFQEPDLNEDPLIEALEDRAEDLIEDHTLRVRQNTSN